MPKFSLVIIELTQPFTFKERFEIWETYSLTDEEYEEVLLFLKKPPQTFKILGSFYENIEMLSEKFGFKICHQVYKQPSSMPFLDVVAFL